MSALDRFLHREKVQRITDAVSTVCIVMSILSVGIALVFLVDKYYLYSVLCLIAFGIFLLSLVYIGRKYYSETADRYEFRLDGNISYEEMQAKLGNMTDTYYVGKDCSVYLLKAKHRKYRILIYKTDEFDSKRYSAARKNANHAFNRKYSVRTRVSILEAATQSYINIAFVGGLNGALEKRLDTPADDCMNRASALLSVAIVDGKLYIPYYVGSPFTLSAIYYEMCRKIFEVTGK